MIRPFAYPFSRKIRNYDGDAVRANRLMRGILPIIPPKVSRRQAIACDFQRYKDRNRIERMFGYLKHQRRIATRYDETALSFASFLNLAAIRRWLPDLSKEPSNSVLGWSPAVTRCPRQSQNRQPSVGSESGRTPDMVNRSCHRRRAVAVHEPPPQ